MFKLTLISKMFLGAPLFVMAFNGDAAFLLGIFLAGLAFNMVPLGVWFYRVWIRRKTGSLRFITLKSPGTRSTARVALRIVRVRAGRAGLREQRRERHLRLHFSAVRYLLRSARVHGTTSQSVNAAMRKLHPRER
jgi:hypothetical protein